jgi:integrase
MATIKERRRKDGSTGYTAIIRLRKKGKVLHEEAATYSSRALARAWAKRREVELEDPKALLRAQGGGTVLKDLIQWYIDNFRAVANWGRNKQSTLLLLQKQSIGLTDTLDLTVPALVEHIRKRRAAGAGPSTAGNDLTWIGSVLRAAQSVLGLPVQPELVEQARNACRELRLIRRSGQRDRRPTTEELQRLDQHFRPRERRSRIPMNDILWFAIETSRREDEICRLFWEDIDEQKRTGLVRDAKHPTDKQGNHRRFKFTQEAWEILQRQPRISPYVFPYNPKSVGTAFTRACHMLHIQDLHFHDMRHEATSRFFERGYDIHEVPQFTLHESWATLKRYTQLKPENIRELSWRPPSNSQTSTVEQSAPILAEGQRSPRARDAAQPKRRRRLSVLAADDPTAGQSSPSRKQVA